MFGPVRGSWPDAELPLRREDFGLDGVDVGDRGAVFDDAGAETEFGVERGVGEIDAAAGDDTFQNVEIQLIEFGFRKIPFTHKTKTDRAELDGGLRSLHHVITEGLRGGGVWARGRRNGRRRFGSGGGRS